MVDGWWESRLVVGRESFVVDDVASLFTVLETRPIPIPVLFPMNLLVVAKKSG